MLLNLKFKTCLITFILLFSSLSIFIISPINVKAEDSLGETLYFTKYNVSMDFEEFIQRLSNITGESLERRASQDLVSLINDFIEHGKR